MVKRKAWSLLVASSLLMLPVAATAQSDNAGGIRLASKGGAVTAGALIERYSVLAGSPENAKSLVNGLRSKSEVVLVGQSTTPPTCMPGRPCTPGGSSTTTVKFLPPTDAMGFGSVDVALALLEADLKAKKVSTVKPQHIKASLVGERMGAITFEGILKLRAEGMGWGEIAKHIGVEMK